jgi:hypothetical protein
MNPSPPDLLEGEELLSFSPFKGEIERGMGYKALCKHLRVQVKF